MMRKYQALQKSVLRYQMARISQKQSDQEGMGKSTYEKAQDKAQEAWDKVKEKGTQMSGEINENIRKSGGSQGTQGSFTQSSSSEDLRDPLRDDLGDINTKSSGTIGGKSQDESKKSYMNYVGGTSDQNQDKGFTENVKEKVL